MSSQVLDRVHPVTAFAGRLSARLAELAGVPLWSLSPDGHRETLVKLARAKAQLAALELRVLAEAERARAGDVTAAASVADWVATKTQQTRVAARSDLRLARAVEQHDLLSAAMGRGEVHPAQARAIVTALDRLPASGEFAVTWEQRVEAEAHLVGLAADHDAKALALLGKRIFEVIAPELSERFEGQALEAEEAAALRRTTLELREDDEGTCHGRFRIPVLHGQMLRKMIQSLTQPVTDPGQRLPGPVEHGVAFCDLLERIPAKSLPRSGGCSAAVVVTMTLDQLLSGLGAAELDTGGQISAAEARRLACTAGIIPVVLGGISQVLDVGRRRRFHTESMRVAMSIRDRGCTADGCERPPAMCHAHHDQPWSKGGLTNVESGRLLCGHHHRRIHDPAYDTAHHPNGRVSFHRRT